ncbi:glycosyltransferase [Paenibacillus crassostreae]|uniref:Glycosyltransferase 2-like domain-containing protein n=1 Tax=Paenibacillus crassostreae TaxID=1763538 RepID=A0A167GM94_9BACL|nr:glycosyltransferase [Paenibacillus crassostreae]AOZ92246.1 hypothetical protein LPB68_08420 [Paenibacillus crassostreae]OAB77709.1 hypothetical protein PNBC_01500 [Paenibacillus crassostreae]
MGWIGMETAALFNRFGLNSHVEEGGQSINPAGIAIGTNVYIRSRYWFNVIDPHIGDMPKIIIGDGCQCNLGLILSAVNRIELETNVLIGPNVYISDTDHQYREVGVPVLSQGITTRSDQVIIGEGAWIGANAVIVGNVRIGRGSVVSANSVVVRNVPDYCVVGGAPAKVLKVYQPATNEWVRTNTQQEVEQLLKQRKEEPLLSICIPTYNRSTDLEKCLTSIYSQIGNCDLFEVCISDNASDDSTPSVVERFRIKYNNLKYQRNATNIGADRNIQHVLGQGRGKFLKLQGDDDFFMENTLIPLLHVLYKHHDCAVFHIDLLKGGYWVDTGEGLAEYLKGSSISGTFISSMILQRDAWLALEDKSKYIDSSFNQLYWQYAILAQQPKFCIIHRSMFTYAGNDPIGYNFGRVFIESYQKILQSFIDNGLTEADIRENKKNVLYSFIIPWYARFVTTGQNDRVEGFEQYFTEYYGEEKYYEEALQQLRAIT